MSLLFIPFNNQNPMTSLLAQKLSGEIGEVTLRNFPDGETYVRVTTPCSGREVVVVSSLHQPDDKIISLIFLSETLKELGAKKVGLICPYLAYMRQDRRFHEGEGVTSRYFAKLLSDYFDWLITVDPHLHRYHDLGEVYTIPHRVVHAAPVVSDWIHDNITKPLLIGPDSESEQWVSDVAERANAPHIVLTKTRHGDRDVEVSVPEVEKWKDHTPVLVDDIISTGRTMIETIEHLKKVQMKPPICIGVHAIFADDADKALLKAGASQIITCNSIPHSSNRIDVSNVIVQSVKDLQSLEITVD